MQKSFGLAVALVLVAGALLAAPAGAQAQSTAEQIADAVLPLSDDLRAGAAVVTYDKATGARKVLREGTNQVECQSPDMEAMQTVCYAKSLAPQMDLQAKLTAEGKSPEEVQAGIAAARDAGTLAPVPFGAMAYALRHDDRRIKLMWVMMVPGATSESIGVSTVTERNDGLAGKGRPWLMAAGTPNAHIMIPINGTEYSDGQ
ncbi:MAG: hypothetical protein QGG24_05375 [Vicinamibacterales bacterium]|jgi:hypothetical protein|nr:hypothetical protein [Acidobacteriota bacterium]MDP7294734.1 hypothetical protein [Vicinamibacterales bacterium]MDP7471754.1 hypothetical protein [Vicinamibacterales bacterium]MDP7672408.1 hypothetical protein [Vicinamibacterales bacterium]HJO37492.1 hypothetical protein [Vicinamibacterales bacterium]|tara:strand:- start:7143 stop:7748 length:606 start_codon:yes stop_codon:yes gene_type:complete